MGECLCGGGACRLDADDARHGTINGYRNLRCRCGECREANRVVSRKQVYAWRQANIEKGLTAHGKPRSIRHQVKPKPKPPQRWIDPGGLTSETVLEKSGLTYRQLDHACRKGYMFPSVANANGCGTYRRFSELDLLACKLAKRFIEEGVTAERAWNDAVVLAFMAPAA